ncbi:MAG: efflux RND transporter permease subunit, partial [Candidatus Tectimicrobiota bacterium]
TLIGALSASLFVALVFNPTLCAFFMNPPSPERLEAKQRGRGEGTFLRRYRQVLDWILQPAEDGGTMGGLLRNWALLVAFVGFCAMGVAIVLLAFLMEEPSPLLLQVAGLMMLVGGLAFTLQGILWAGWSLARRLVFSRRWPPYLTDRRAGVIWTVGAILALTVVAYGFLGQGMEFFPEMEPRQIFVDVEAPSGTTLDTSDEVVRRVEALTGETRDLRHVIANVGSTGISMDSFAVSGSVSNRSRITLDLLDREERTQRNSLLTLEETRQALSGIGGAEIKVEKPQEGPPTGKPVTIRISGHNFRVLERLSREVQENIRAVPGLVNLDDDLDRGKPEMRVRVDRVQAALAGVFTGDIAATVQTAVRGAEVSQYRIGEDEYDIVVRLEPESRATLDDLAELTVPDEDGIPIPIGTVARLEPGVGPASIRRVDLKRVVTIEGDVVRAKGRTEDSVREEVAKRLETIDWPAGYRWSFAGSNEEEIESRNFLQRAFVIAVLLIMLVLVTQFDSLVLPLTIMVSVVLSLIGVLWGLILTGTPFGIIMTGIGVISLAGVVVNNAIVLCDFIRQLRDRGLEKTQAVIEAGVIRLRPVLLTAVTTVLGLIPLTIGLNVDFFEQTIQTGGESSQWWGAMGVAVIAGLTVATVLTLVIVPVTYHSLDAFSGALANLPHRLRRKDRTPEPFATPAPGEATRTDG